MDLSRTEVDGVATLHLDDGAVPGPLAACLAFNTGKVDETLATSGINHIVEHLALRHLGATGYSWNGMVDSVSTRFLVMGSPEAVVEFFGEVCTSLSALSLDALEHELGVLQIEERQRGVGQLGFDLNLRFGARGAGLLGWPEHGLRRLQAADVAPWVADRFMIENAVFWISGPVPRGLSLRGLPSGAAASRPAPAAPLSPARAYLASSTAAVSLSVISDQQWSLGQGLEIARQRASDQLRRTGSSYGIQLQRVRIGGGQALELLMADGAAGSYEAVFDGLSGTVDALADAGPTPAEMATMERFRRELSLHPQRLLHHLENAGERHLLGLPPFSVEEADARAAAVGATQIAEELRAVLPSLLAIVPAELGDDRPGWTSYPTSARTAVAGTVYPPIEGREKGTLTLGEEGATWRSDAFVSTVRWRDLAACLVWDNGLRRIIGNDGFAIVVAPWAWHAGYEIVDWIDQVTPTALRVAMGPGETHYLFDPQDPGSKTDRRWLASLVGVTHERQRADLLIHCDGVALLRGTTPPALTAQRLATLRRGPREDLLAAHASNRWIRSRDVDHVKLGLPHLALAPLGTKSRATFHLHSGEQVKVDFASADQVRIATNELRKLFGSRLRTR